MNRISTETLSRLGSSPTIVYDGNLPVLRFTNRAGNNIGSANGNITNDIPVGLSADKFSYLLAYFQGTTGSIERANAMLQVHLDAALIYNVDPVDLLAEYSSQPKNSFYLDLENLFRTVGAKQGYVTQNTNVNSKVSRQVRG